MAQQGGSFACQAAAPQRLVLRQFLPCHSNGSGPNMHAAVAHAQSPNMIESWKVDITFTNGESRSLRFDAQGRQRLFPVVRSTLEILGARQAFGGKVDSGRRNSVVFSGPVEFLIGNVGRDAGTLLFKGKFETDGSIRGEVEFSPLGGGQPSKQRHVSRRPVPGADNHQVSSESFRGFALPTR